MPFDRAKILAEGGTYHDAANPLIECTVFQADRISWEGVAETGAAPASIKEDANLPKRMVIEGVFQRFMPAGEDPKKYRNANRRVYTMERVGKKVLDENGDVQRRIAERAMIGHLEHPQDGTTDLNKGAILITKVWAESDGTIKGRAMVYNTPEGQRIQEYITTGTKIGISSRGTGTVDQNGFVCEDFALETWDMVYNPSTFGAHPGLKTESADSERTVQNQKVAESASVGASPLAIAAPAGKTQTQDKNMNVAERLGQIREQAARLLATDAARLTTEQRRALAAELLNLRVQVAEEFTGERRTFAESLIKSLAEAHAAVESTMSDTVGGVTTAPLGQTDAAGIPGNTWDMLNKAVAGAGDARTKAVESIKSIADMIAANLGKLPEIQVATEAAVKGAPETKPALPAEVREALAAARDEILNLTERDEAATAIADELAERLANTLAQLESLVSENAELKAAAEKSAQVIADLTSAKTAGKVAESVQPSAQRKTVAERLVKPQPRTEDDSALPPTGAVTESAKDAGVVAKPAIKEHTASRGAALAAVALRESAKA